MLAVAARHGAEPAFAGSVERFRPLESGRPRNRGNRQVAGLQQTANGFNAAALDVDGRRGAHLCPEGPGERPGTHARPPGQGLDAQVVGQVIG